MKKLLYLLLIIVLITSLVGCKSNIEKEKSYRLSSADKSTSETLTIKDYFPFKDNIVMDYEGRGFEYAEQITFFEFVEGNRAQMKIMNPGTVLVSVLENKNGALREVYFEGEFYHIENMINTSSNTDNIILKEPLEVGNTWLDAQGNSMEITSVDQEIDTPSGTYKALEVTTEYENGESLKEYYAKDIGLVAKIYEYDEFKVETLLKNTEIKKQELEIMSFYPTKYDIGTAYVIRDIEFATNDNIESILEDIMKNPPNDKLLPTISMNTKINSIHLDRDSWTLKVDFSKELFGDMNAGSSLENEILKSITNTLGKFYDVEKVYLSIDDKPYESGHFGINQGEYFSVDTTDIEEFNE